MKHWLLGWVLNAFAIWVVAQLVPGFAISGAFAALFAALAIGFINGTVGLVLKIMTLPLTILTLGLFWLVINALMIVLASMLIPGFDITGFWAAFFGAIVLSLVNMVLQPLVGDGD